MQARARNHWALAFLGLSVVAFRPWEVVARLLQPPGADLADPAIRLSGQLAVWLWAFGAKLAVDHYRPGRVEPRPWFRLRRAVWTFGCAGSLLHLAVALHAGHAWSHDSAREHIAAAGGFGGGVYVNYAFALTWAVDACALWLLPRWRRPAWVSGAVHGFLAFIVFNATVVFGVTPLVRAGGGLIFTYLGWALIAKRRRAAVERDGGRPGPP